MINPYEIINAAMRSQCARLGQSIGTYDAEGEHADVTYSVSPHVLANEIGKGYAREIQAIRVRVEQWHERNPTVELDAVLMLLDQHISNAEASTKTRRNENAAS